MNGRTFVDTNVLIYAHDVDAKSKHATAKNILRELWTARTGVLSMQVLQEFYVNITRKIRSPLPKESARLKEVRRVEHPGPGRLERGARALGSGEGCSAAQAGVG